jgi:O-acetyl-ADP-ribose deacetylase (regulator of RNase III)
MHVVSRLASPRFLINFPTKRHWRHPSKLEYIQNGLQDLIEQVKRLDIASIAVPPLGCGHGGLDWSVVRPIILDAFATVPHVRVVLFEPMDAPPADFDGSARRSQA